MQRIGKQPELGMLETHVIGKDSLLGIYAVFTIIRNKSTLAVIQLAILIEIAEIHIPVKIKTVRFEHRILVHETHIAAHARQIGITVIIEIITEKEERIALFHPYITECREGVVLLVIMRTVAIHVDAVATKPYITDKNPRIGIHLLVETCDVGMQHVNIAL
jgi:hypothetical protein